MGLSAEAWEERKTKPRRPLRYLMLGGTRVVENPIGRNEPCSCGSGTKYKTCCLYKALDGETNG